MNGSTTNLNEHQCQKIAAKNQQLDEAKRGEAKSIHKILPRFWLWCMPKITYTYFYSRY
jgi:hypothetical protein